MGILSQSRENGLFWCYLSIPMSIATISVEEFASYLQTTDSPVQLVDVREPQEVEIASVDGFINLPLSQHDRWGDRIQEFLDPQQETFVLCHHGMRSAQMCQWLQQQGFKNVKNIAGGIEAYAVRVDPQVPRY